MDGFGLLMDSRRCDSVRMEAELLKTALYTSTDTDNGPAGLKLDLISPFCQHVLQ